MHDLFVCLLWSQVGFEHVAAIEFGGFGLRVFINSQGYGALRYGQLDPVSDTEFLGAGHELLHSTLYLGPRMVGEVLILLGDLGLKRRQFRVPGVPDFLGPHRIPPQHVADALIREHLGQLLIEEVQLQGPLLQQFFNLGFRNGRNVMEPLLREVFDVLAFDHAPIADEGDLVDVKPRFDLVDLCRKGLRILRIARKYFDRDWMAVLVAE